MSRRLDSLLELARRQFDAQLVLAFRWMDDSTAEVCGSLPYIPPLHTAVDRSSQLVISIPRSAVEDAGGIVVDAGRPRSLVSSELADAIKASLGGTSRMAAMIAAEGGEANAPGGDGEQRPSAGGLLVVWLDEESVGIEADSPAEVAAHRSRLLASHGPSLRAVLGIVMASTADILAAGQLAVRLDAIMASIPQAVIFVDDINESCAVNHAASALFGIAAAITSVAVVTERLEAFQRTLENADEVCEQMRRLMLERTARVEDWIWRVGYPNRRSLRVTTTPVSGAGLRGRLWTFDDISRVVDAEQVARVNETRFRALSSAAPIGIFRTDASGRMEYVNPRMLEIWQLSEQEMLGLGWRSRIHPDDLQNLLERRAVAIETVDEYDLHYRLVHSDGVIRHAHGQTALLRDESGKLIGGIGTVRDVTEKLMSERSLADSEERLRLALEAGQMSAWELTLPNVTHDGLDDRDVRHDNADGVARSLRQLSFSYSGTASHVAYRGYAEFLNAVHPDDRGRVDAAASRALAERRDFEDEFRVLIGDGDVRWRHVKGRMLLSDDGAPARMVGVSMDSTVRKTLEQELVRRAYHDTLTGLANRARFRERVEHAVARTTQAESLVESGGRERVLAVLFVDLDGFKSVNDELGHDTGDRLLVLSAGRIQGATRDSDAAARLGGDEFAILLDRTGGEEDARLVAARVVEAMARPFDLDGREVSVGASVGIAIARDGDDADTLMRNADAAMYRAKRSGKGRHAS